jgi:hypothetical protein
MVTKYASAENTLEDEPNPLLKKVVCPSTKWINLVLDELHHPIHGSNDDMVNHWDVSDGDTYGFSQCVCIGSCNIYCLYVFVLHEVSSSL